MNQCFKEKADVGEVESCSGLIQKIEGGLRAGGAKFAGELEPLRLSTRKGLGGLIEAKVAEP